MAMFNISSKYNNIISKSILISSGHLPAVYQLKPKEQKIGNLTRKTFGERNKDKKNKTILLVGETGAGKSTMINTLVNYIMGVRFEENIWFEIVKDEKKSRSETQTTDETKSQSVSQTSDVIVYEIFGFEGETLPYSLTIIDTPGYGDTRGIEHDVNINQQLLDLFFSGDGVHEIDAVGLVLKSTLNRLSDRMKYVFDAVASLFGKDMEQNIVTLMTFSNGATPEDALKALEDAQIKGATNEKKQRVYFLFDNCQKQLRTEEDEFALEYAWRVTERGMKQFTDFLNRSKPQQLKTTLEVLKARIRITACIQNLQERIQLTELQQNQIKQIEEALRKHEQEMDENKEFIIEVNEVVKVKELIDDWWNNKAVTCNICEENCHYPGCTLAWNASWCEVMKDGRCTSCTGKCPAKDHVKGNWKYVTKTKRCKKTEKELKQMYEKNKTKSEKEKSLLENLQTEMEELKSEKNQFLDEAYQLVDKLQSIALNVDSLSTYVHLDFLIEKMKERGDTEKVQKLEEIRKRGDEGTKSVLRYRYIGKLTTAGKAVKGAVMWKHHQTAE